MVDSIAKQISRDGPVAWFRYFDDSPGFFTASDDQLVFPNIDSAKNFVTNTLVEAYGNIELHWNNIRIVPVTARFAILASGFHEDITCSNGNKSSTDGYFTGMAHQTA